jgi:hypothetical protein
MLFSPATGWLGRRSKMEAKQGELTPREQAYFEHVRRAKEAGLTLKAYCEQRGLNVRSLYGVRRMLMEKGVLPRALPPKSKAKSETHAKKKGSGKFEAVRLAEDGPSEGQAVCRVRHPSAWTIECGRFPEAGWVMELMKGADHASA